MSNRIIRLIIWPTAVVLVLGSTYALYKYSQPRRHGTPVSAAGLNDPAPQDDDDYDWKSPPETTSVNTVKPRKGAMERITVQVGSVETDEVQLFAQVTGILKKQTVDIGDRVDKDKLLAEIEVPELTEQVRRNKANVELSEARVEQTKAKVVMAKAELEAAKSQITYAEAQARAAAATVKYRDTRLKQWKSLAATNSIEGVLVDIAMEQYDAARESEIAAKANVLATRAKVDSSDAKILVAKADVLEAEAQVKVAQAELAKAAEQLKFAQIKAPFEGIITHRAMVPGGLVRSAAVGGAQAPLLTIQRTDKMRMVVQIPDRDVPFADAGDSAHVEIDAFPGVKFEARVSRIAKTEHAGTRLMPIEIDLPDPDKKIRQGMKEIRHGMFGKVTIVLDKATEHWSVPSHCLAGKSKSREGTVFVEKEGKAYRRKVKLGIDNGVRVEVLHGLDGNDRVIQSPPRGLTDGLEVQATLVDDSEPKDDATP